MVKILRNSLYSNWDKFQKFRWGSILIQILDKLLAVLFLLFT